MFNRKSSYALNKKDPNAIVYMDANEAIMLPMLSLLFRFFFSVKTSHKSFQQKCAEVRECVYPVLMPDIVL